MVHSVYIKTILTATEEIFTSLGRSSEEFGGIPAPSITQGFFDDTLA